jgi:hypothetical protein
LPQAHADRQHQRSADQDGQARAQCGQEVHGVLRLCLRTLYPHPPQYAGLCATRHGKPCTAQCWLGRPLQSSDLA